jgi:pyruvate dehydrogenase E2 component (dihydrolipoamide acetyltransferase)
MPIEITMPRLSDTMEEGTLIGWRVKVGDKVESGDVLADVETDKATMELQAYDDGTVAKLAASEGETLPVGGLILVLAEDGESVDDAAAKAGDGGDGGGDEAEPAAPEGGGDEAEPAAPEGGESKAESASGDAAEASTAAPTPPSSGVKASPLARKLADEHGVDIASIEGSGPGGRVIKRDVLAAAEGKATPKAGGGAPEAKPKQPAEAPAPRPAPAAAGLESKTVTVSNMRKTIARRLVESKTTIPHFTVTVSINMDPLMQLRATLNEQLEPQGVKLSVNDFIVRATAMACVQHPHANSSWSDAGIVLHGTVNVGVAVAIPIEQGGGLVVPVIRDAQTKGLRQISDETRQLAEKARTKGLSLDDMADGTLTLSNLGMYGVDHFEAIINPPQAVILAVGGAMKKPVVRDGELTVGTEMTVTLSGDHRVVDGAVGAQYLQSLKQMLENPAVLMV